MFTGIDQSCNGDLVLDSESWLRDGISVVNVNTSLNHRKTCFRLFFSPGNRRRSKFKTITCVYKKKKCWCFLEFSESFTFNSIFEINTINKTTIDHIKWTCAMSTIEMLSKTRKCQVNEVYWRMLFKFIFCFFYSISMWQRIRSRMQRTMW